MKAPVFASAFLFALALGISAGHAADETKGKAHKAAAGEVTLKGDMVCAKCTLHEGDKCQNVLKVSEGSTQTNYYLADNKTAKDNHEKVCSGKPASATVTGKVKESGGKKVLTASSVSYE